MGQANLNIGYWLSSSQILNVVFPILNKGILFNFVFNSSAGLFQYFQSIQSITHLWLMLFSKHPEKDEEAAQQSQFYYDCTLYLEII